jgi:hypothetical protein
MICPSKKYITKVVNMQRVEINPNLGPDYIKIARILKEVKETAYTVSIAAKRTLEVLRARKLAGGLTAQEDALLDDAILHYGAIAKKEDAWPQISTVSLATEESIIRLFLEAIPLLKTDPAIQDRINAYGWVSANVGKLNQLLTSLASNFTDAEAKIVQELYKPTTRMGLLKSLIDSLQQGLNAQQLQQLQGAADALKAEAAHITARMNRAVPEAGFDMSPAGRAMLQQLNLFAPENLNKELYEYELEDLETTIKTVQPRGTGDFKGKLLDLHAQIGIDVRKQKAAGKTVEQITHSPAMELCRYTHRMLDVVLNNQKSPDEKLVAIKTFQTKSDQTTGLCTFLKVVGAIAIAAAITVLLTAAIVGIASIIGTFCGGPAGTIAGAVAGLAYGSYTAAGIGVAAASLVTGVTVSAAVSPFTLFKKSDLRMAAEEVTKKALDYKDSVVVVAAQPA